MQCPLCGYAMSAFDVECPRCHGKGQPQQDTPPKVVIPSQSPPQAHWIQPAQSHPMAVPVFCRYCGYQNQIEDLFCANCGTPAKEQTAFTHPQPSPPPQQVHVHVNQQNNNGGCGGDGCGGCLWTFIGLLILSGIINALSK